MDIEKYRSDIDKLLNTGTQLYAVMVKTVEALPESHNERLEAHKEKLEAVAAFENGYQAWYSEALACVKQLLPDRLEDFISFYKTSQSRNQVTQINCTISDFLMGFPGPGGLSTAVPVMRQQLSLVAALKDRFESSLFEIRALVQADFFDDELEVSEELNEKGFHRAAGAVCGVVLEGHLATVCNQHNLAKPKNATIGELNDLLKKNNVIEIPNWRFIQRLGDLRNLCDHKKAAEPKKEDSEELIAGVEKVIKTVF